MQGLNLIYKTIYFVCTQTGTFGRMKSFQQFYFEVQVGKFKIFL